MAPWRGWVFLARLCGRIVSGVRCLWLVWVQGGARRSQWLLAWWRQGRRREKMMKPLWIGVGAFGANLRYFLQHLDG